MKRPNSGATGAPDDSLDSRDAEESQAAYEAQEAHQASSNESTADWYTPIEPPQAHIDRAGEPAQPYPPNEQFEPYEPDEPDESHEHLYGRLTQFAFVREEDDCEVRLFFRDVPADEIAASFRRSGATLISMMGERALSPSVVSARPESGWVVDTATGVVEVVSSQSADARGRKNRSRNRKTFAAGTGATPTTTTTRTGQLTMRYFYSLSELVYTVIIASSTGLVESIKSIYPSAALSEQELQTRLAIVFRERG